MLLQQVVDSSTEIKSTRSRLAKIAALADLLEHSRPNLIPLVVAYLSGELPQGKIGVGYSLVQEAEAPPAPEATLALADVDGVFNELAGISGPGSEARRRRLLVDLMETASESEQAFLRGLMLGELRQGASAGIMEEAIAKAAGVPVGLIRRAAMVSGDLPRVGGVALSGGGEGLADFRPQIFSPLQPMLAQTAEDTAAALEKTGPAAVEYKIDGARIQVHRRGNEARVYTRNLRDITDWIPEVIETVAAFEVHSLILDGEAIALDDRGRPRPFQVTMRRFGRRLEVDRMRAEIPLVAFFFDCLHLNGEDLIDEPATRRAAALASVVEPGLRAPRMETSDPIEADAFLREALAAGHEGVMVKALDASYEAGRRGAGWIKVKPVHTLDLVVLAVEWGSGRRQGWLSNLHLGARDPETGNFVMLGKTFKGLTDQRSSAVARPA